VTTKQSIKLKHFSPDLAVLCLEKAVTASGGKRFANNWKKADFYSALKKCKEAAGSIATPRSKAIMMRVCTL